MNARMNLLKVSLFTLFLSFTAFAAFGQGSTIRGSVVDENGEPVIGANVIIFELQTGAATNLDGIFSIPRIPKGTHELRVTYLGMDTSFQTVETSGTGTTTISFKLNSGATSLETVEIMDKTVGKINKRVIDVGTERISARQINLMPSLGTPDLAQYLQVLPGVVFTGDQGGQLYVRGGTPVQNMVLMDGMIVYSPFHSIGLFSIFDTDYLRSVDVYSAAFPARYGGRVSSIMDLRTRNPTSRGLSGKVNINPLTAGVLVEAPFGSKREGGSTGSGILLSARRSYLNMTSQSLYSYVNDSTGLPFSFTDIYGKLTFSDGLNRVNFFGLYNKDDVDFQFPSNLTWTQYGGGMQFRFLPQASNMIFEGNFAFSSFESGQANVSENFPRRSLIRGFNGGLRFSYIVNSVDEFKYGVTFLGFRTDYSFTNSFGLITEQIFNNTEAAADFSYKKVIRRIDGARQDSVIDRAVIEPGVHIHYYNDHSHLSLEPRIRAKWNFNRISLSGGAGLYSQNLMAATSDRDVVNLFQGYLAAPENVANQIKSHTLQTASHLLAGVEVELIPNLSTRLEGWYKDFTQLTNVNRDKVFPEDPDFITETGVARGVDLILRYESPRWYIYGTYGLAKVDRKDGIREYNPVWDRRHNANAVISFFDGELDNEDESIAGRPRFTDKKWEFSLRWNLGSGFPFTQTQGFFEKIDFLDNGSQTDYTQQNGNLGVLYAEEINGGRLPYYHRLDISAKRRWQFNNKFLLEAQVSVVNLYNRANVFYFDRIRYATIYQLPLLPSTGLTLKF